MKSYVKTDRHKKINIISICIGLGVSIIITLLGILVSSYIASNTVINNNYEIIATWGIWVISSFVGCVVGKVTSKEYHILEAIMIGISYLLVMIAIQIVFFDGMFRRLLEGIMAIILGVLIFVLVSSYKTKKQNKKFKFKY